MGGGKLQERFYVDIMSTSSAVTGSCNLVVVKLPNGSTIRFTVDCGLFLEKNVKITTKIFHSTREKWILRC